ncbi:MAG: aspartyl protease family protein [Proteobacteria bacterium]|nr:aspartyl protease family protein [Pseudomonadota bacterium]
MNTRKNLSAIRGSSVACVIVALSSQALAFQHHGPQSRPDQPLAWDVHFPAGVSMVEIPFREVMGMIFVDVKINGSEPQSLVIESGWSAPSLLLTEDAESFDFEYADYARPKEGGHGDFQMGRLAQNVKIEFGDLRIEGVEFEVASRAENEFLGMLPEDGVLGVKLLEKLVVEIDWEQGHVRLHDPSTFKAPDDAVPVPLTFKHGLSYANGEVTIDGKSQRIKFIVDTGSAGTLLVRSDKTGVPERRISDVTLGQSLHGLVKGDIGRIDRLTIGGANLKNMVSRFLDKSSGMIAVGSDGNLGNGVLRRFTVTFDYSRSRMLLKPNDAIDDPFPFSTSGMALDREIDDDGSIGIRRIYDDAPAARAGLKVGDRIVAMNSQPVADLGIDAIRELLRQSPGTRVRLQIRQADSVREVELELDIVL